MSSRSVPSPESVGRFKVDAVLGAGGMGEVYKATDPTLRRTVAVKTVRPDISNPDYLDRLVREAQACASLQHPNIVTVYEAGKIDGAVYMVMEYLEGEDLAQVLNRGGLNFEERIRVLMQILDALEHAHSKGVVHRDIKPSNIRMLSNGQIKLVDFGLARMAKAETLTATGMVMGTPHYASPEQLRGESIDRRTDIYSTGTMAYEMCSGRRPFEGENNSLTTIILKVVSEPPPPMNVPWSRSFPEIEKIVNRAMAKAREDRYQTAEDFRNALAAFLSTSRDLITAIYAQDTVTAQRTVIEAQGLVAAGKTGEAQTLLSQTLKVNPTANGVRQFLDELNTLPPAPNTTMLPEDDRTMPVSQSALAPTMVDTGPAPAPYKKTVPLAPPPIVNTDLPPLKPSSNAKWWAGGLAAAAAFAVALIGLPGFGNNTTNTTTANVPAASAPAPGVAAATPAAPSPSPAATDTSKPVEPAPPPANAPATPTSTTAAATAAAAKAAAAPPALAAANKPAGDAAPAPANVGAKTLFYGDPKLVATGGVPNPAPTGLRYRLVQASAGGNETDVDPATAVFKSGDRVRLAFESNIDGYLYVVQEGSSGRWTVLFPNPESNGGRNTIRRGAEYMVPPDGWFQFDENVGTELLFVVLSKEPLSELPGFAKSGAQPERLNASVVESVQNSIRSRDLTFARDERPQTIQGGKIIQANYVVNRAELGKSVAVSLSLKHQ
jgi:serine/threonine protein kinase